MTYRPVLQALGFDETDRVAIVHADDIGMCEATVSAFAELSDFGLVTSGSAMVPCAWFPAVAALAQARPHLDLGVHFTLTSEWDGYRWGPLSSRQPDSGLVDALGYFPSSRETVVHEARPAAVRAEMRAQIEQARRAGLDVTHLDAHMFTALRQPFLSDYVALGNEYQLPTLLWPLDRRPHIGCDDEERRSSQRQIERWAAEGQARLIDHHIWTRMSPPAADIELVKRMLADIPPGLTRFYIHPAKDTPELRRIIPDWRCRVADFEIFTSEELRDYVRGTDIRLIGFRALRDAIRRQAVADNK